MQYEIARRQPAASPLRSRSWIASTLIEASSGPQCHHAFCVVRRARVIIDLQAGFNNGPVDLRTLLRLGIVVEESFEIADKCCAIVPCIFNRFLQ